MVQPKLRCWYVMLTASNSVSCLCAAEILELAGNAARDNRKSRVTPRHILLAVANDEELHKLLHHVTIASGGVLPKIHPELIARKKAGKWPNHVAGLAASGFTVAPPGAKKGAPTVRMIPAATPAKTAARKTGIKTMPTTLAAKAGKGKARQPAGRAAGRGAKVR